MDTKMMSQFAVMDNEMLARIEGVGMSLIFIEGTLIR